MAPDLVWVILLYTCHTAIKHSTAGVITFQNIDSGDFGLTLATPSAWPDGLAR